jgi:hypothetical protein
LTVSHQAIELQTNTPIGTVFYGGLARGKVVQLHLSLHQLEREPEILGFLIEESDSGFVKPFGEWIRENSVGAGMVLFTEVGAEPKIQTIEVR